MPDLLYQSPVAEDHMKIHGFPVNLTVSVGAAVLIVLCVSTHDISSELRANAEADRLFGEWEVIEMLRRGVKQDIPVDMRERFRMEQSGSFSRSNNGKFQFPMRCIFRANEFDLVIQEEFKGLPELRLEAIYKIEDGLLYIAWNNDLRNPRPSSFDVNDKNLTVFILKRTKDDK